MKQGNVSKHVVILVENLPVPFDRRPWQIAQTLTAAGHRVSVVCPRMYEYTASYERLKGIDIYRYPSREGDTPVGWILEYLNALFWMMLICLRLFLTRGIDAIHACNPPDLLFMVAWPFKVFFGTRFLFDHHDLNPEVYEAKFGRRDRIYHALVHFEQLTYALADISLATNQSFKRIAIERSRISGRRVFIVRNAPMPGRLVPGPGREQLKAGKRHLVAYLGVMNKQDGLDLLLEAARHVIQVRGRDDVLFGLIGDGTELANLKEQSRRMGLNGQVAFLGRISDGRMLSDYLNTATVCVCPDPKNAMNDHSTMTKVVEYMALGKPVVAFDLKETLYSAGDTAVYATNNDPKQLGDLIADLLDQPARCAQLGSEGKARYDRMLSWDRSQEQLLAAYRALLRPRAGDVN